MHALVITLGPPEAPARARRLAASAPHAKVVLVVPADDDHPAAAEEAGRLAAELHGAVFVGEDGLADFLQELFGERSP